MADAQRLRLLAPTQLAQEGNVGFTNQALTTQDFKVGWVFSYPYAEAITGAKFRYGARTSTPPQHTISLQSLDASGLPSGTILGGGSPASQTFTPPANTTWDGLVQSIAFANAYTPARGERMALVIDATSNPSAGSSSFTRNNTGGLSFLQNFPYHVINTGSWAKGGNSYGSVFGVYSASHVYGFPLQSTTVQSTGTTGRRVAMKFNLASGWGDSFKVVGLAGIIPSPTNAGTFTLGLWNAAGTVLASKTGIDSDANKGSGTNGYFEDFFADATLPTLSYGTDYYIGFECEGSVTVRMTTLDFAAAGDLACLPGGTTCCYSLWNGAAWADTTTSRPWAELMMDDITEPAGGGGGLITPIIGNGGLVF